MNDLIMRYIEEHDFSPATVRSYRNTLIRFKDNAVLGSTTPSGPHFEIKPDQFWMGLRGLAPASKAAYIRRVRAFLGWLYHKDDRPDILGLGVMLRELDATRSHTGRVKHGRWLSRSEVRKVLDSFDPRYDDVVNLETLRMDAILRFGFTMGLRRQEIVDLEWNMIDLEGQKIHMTGKGGKVAIVYIPNRLVQTLANIHDTQNVVPLTWGLSVIQGLDYQSEKLDWTGQGISARHLARLVQQASDASLIEFSPHDMRRTFAGLMFEEAGLVATSKALRHSSVATTEKYLEQRPDAAFHAVREAGLEL